MGAHLQNAENASPKLKKAQDELAALNNELKLDLIQAGIDVAGIADPTPASDGLNALISLGRGNFIDAGLSLISMVPYAGDAVAKTTKGARLAAKMAKLKTKIARKIVQVNKLKKKAAEEAAGSVQRVRAAAAQAKIAAKKKKCATCKITTNPYGSRLPADGTWTGTRGNSAWTPDPKSARAKKINSVTDGKPIPFKDGYPDFSEYATHRVRIDMKGNHSSDFTAANKAANLKETPEGMVWHHHQDGVTMELLPKKLHNNTPHAGGNSIVNDKGY